MRILIATQDFVAVAFSLQVAEFHTEKSLAERSALTRLGPDLLSEDFDAPEAISQIRNHAELEVGDALLRQALLSGIGNVYKSEICFACGVNPFCQVSDLSSAELECLVRTARKLLRANVSGASGAQIVTYTGFRRTTGRANYGERLWVYARAGQPCRRCGAAIERSKEASDARVTFWCPRCSPLSSACFPPLFSFFKMGVLFGRVAD